MLETILWIMVGAFIGWNLPQPQFAKNIQSRVLSFFKGEK